MNRVDYNTERQSMVMAEYGRVVQDMVKYCISIQDREERQQCAQAIVAVMANISQEKLTNIDVQQKMWNHLAVISDFQLDIDYPVEIIKKEEVEEQPAPMALPQSKIPARFYGRILEQALDTLAKMPDGEERDALTCKVANQMKQSLFTWNPDVMSEDKVIRDIQEYCNDSVADALEGHQFAPLQTVSTSINKKKK
ncbi:MAG: DUF4290 domain-containing protein [Bacteroidaceae bacterium]|nr:DUF4290 domain-containing protein [Bacteroidaceae bacterium]